jgi:hypothetical protein
VPIADPLAITEVDREPEGGSRFPEIAAVDREKVAKTRRTVWAGPDSINPDFTSLSPLNPKGTPPADGLKTKT